MRHHIRGEELAGLRMIRPVGADQQVNASVLILPDHVNAQMLTAARAESTPRTYSEVVGLWATALGHDQLSKIKQVVVP